ncbi:MAG: class I SAM-dependent methyltransferase [Anaerolineae bacterium]|nr:class I SAM-dependent methyltransferase [Anaerolineae bacterium]
MTNYNQIAETYTQAEDHPIKTYVERFSLAERLGNLAGQTVLDLACGSGYYTRLIKRLGAATVTGVDLSDKMIVLAEANEAETPLGITYRKQDVTTMGQIGQFDVVTAAYLLPYADSPATLTAMGRAAFDNLKPGGRFLAILTSPQLTTADFDRYTPYGLRFAADTDLRDGVEIAFAADLTILVEFSFYFWEQATLERALRAAGFRALQWHPLHVSPQGSAAFGDAYWQPFLSKPYGVLLEGHKL